MDEWPGAEHGVQAPEGLLAQTPEFSPKSSTSQLCDFGKVPSL